MTRIIVIVIAIVALLGGYRWFRKKQQTLSKAELAKIVVMILLAVCVVLAATGKAHWLAVFAAGAVALLQRSLPMLIRFFPMLQHLYKTNQQKTASQSSHSGNQSRVQSEILLMILDHDSGQLDGEILKGVFGGKQLSELDIAQLKEFYIFCRQEDPESEQLLSAYMQKRFGDAWQHSGPKYEDYASASSTEMSEREALEILGLQEGVGKDEIVKAHRKLMQKLHPDRGGSDYLAAKVNEAKQVLLNV